MNPTILPFISGLAAGLLLTPLAAALSRRIGLYDRPCAAKLHSHATPLLGGLAVLGAMLAGTWLAASGSPILAPLPSAMILAAVAGLIDDVKAVKPLWKLLSLLPAAIAALLLWPQPLPVPLVSIPLFILGFLFVSNAVNLLDTIDGLTGLMTAISAAAMGTMALSAGLSGLSAAAFAMSGACIAFLFFNWRLILPAAVFLGDMGALALGAGLFVLVVYLLQHAVTGADYLSALLPVGLVMANALHTVYVRKRDGVGALARTKDHISERLYRCGLPRWEVTVWLSLVTLVSSAAGVVAWVSASQPVEIVAIAAGVVAIGYTCIHSMRLRPPPEGTPRYQERTICRIITRLDVGGPSQHCVFLCAGLNEMGWCSYLLHGNIDPTQESSMEYLLEREGVEAYRIPTLRRDVRPLADLRALWCTYRVIRRLRPQIVHTHHAKAGTVGRIAAALSEVPIILHTYHGISLRDYFGPISNRIFLSLEQICGRASSALIAIGPNDREELVELRVAAADKFVTIPLGLPLQRFADIGQLRGPMRDELRVTEDQRLVVLIGRMVPIKNASAFIDMAASVLRVRPDVRFLLVGDGPLRAELEAQAENLGIRESVRFYGVTREVQKVYAAADLVVLSSKREGMPVTIMEALAAGVPVVTTRVGNVTNMVIDGVTGRLVPPNDTTALTQAVLAALNDREGSLEMARAGQRRVLQYFSLEVLADRIHALYTALTSQTDYVDPHPLPASVAHPAE